MIPSTSCEIHEAEASRLVELERLALLDSPPEASFDRFTRIASALFDVPIALVSLVDLDRQWFKSRIGLDVTETPRAWSFCGHAILGGEMLVVEDTLLDPRFFDNPLVIDYIRFYAGYPLVSGDVHIGTLCIIDRKPRHFSVEQRLLLNDLGQMLDNEIGSRARVMKSHQFGSRTSSRRN